MTTGTVAVSGVALAGCAPTDSGPDEASVTSPITLGAQFGSQASLANLRTSVINPTSATSPGSIASQVLNQTDLRPKSGAVLRVTNPDVSVKADRPVEMGFSLEDETTHAPLANQLVKVQVKLPDGWATFKHLYTNDQGFTSYTAKVLTTTQITAIFDGTDALRSTRSTNVGTLTVVPNFVPAPPARVSQATTRSGSQIFGTNPSPDAAISSAIGAASSFGERAVYLAAQQAGKPYVYGAEGPYSFDCSGLVQYIFKQLGRNLPRTAEAQYQATTRVSQFNKQVGDLIFYGSPGNIYHVGIYAGNGKMWVAPKSGDVVSLRVIHTTSYSVGRVV
ncbi:C40 family peptidase [Candidatus Protofrankia californiensis]|uniref:C40 family peptidase n=1 Tax=Candidatus Protofrankia californiensis TaxID=1839754 RepID=UPI00104158F8|nr:C40 family peptidase [Candidatus Protofrankia californiensis]